MPTIPIVTIMFYEEGKTKVFYVIEVLNNGCSMKTNSVRGYKDNTNFIAIHICSLSEAILMYNVNDWLA